jgi:hypothetical protein
MLLIYSTRWLSIEEIEDVTDNWHLSNGLPVGPHKMFISPSGRHEWRPYKYFKITVGSPFMATNTNTKTASRFR